MPRRPGWQKSWSGRKSACAVHAQYNGNLRRLRPTARADGRGTAEKIAPPFANMHPGLITRLLDGHADPKRPRKRSRNQCRARTKSDEGHNTKCNGQSDAENGRSAVSDGKPTGEPSCGLMTKMLQRHQDRGLSVRRSAAKCLPSKHAPQIYDPTLKRGLLTSILANHAPSPQTGVRIVPQTPSSRKRHHATGRKHFHSPINHGDQPLMCIPQEPTRPGTASVSRNRGKLKRNYQRSVRPPPASNVKRRAGRRTYESIARKLSKSANFNPRPHSERVLNLDRSEKTSLGGQMMPLQYQRFFFDPSSQ